MIRFFNPAVWRKVARSGARIIFETGTIGISQFDSVYEPEFICDTPEEAEKMRQLIEQRREEREALDRKWELRLAEEVSR